jgi:putative membrane protein
MRTCRSGLVAALGVLGFAGVAGAESSGTFTDVNDRKFVEEAASGGMAEVKLGKLALERAQSKDVRDFARQMIDDHSRADRELGRIASRKNMALPSEIDTQHLAEYQRLSRLSGAEFDRAYMDLMATDHDTDVEAFRKMATSATDDGLRSWVAKTLPTLIDHQQRAHRISDRIKKV